jgi:hypothetical protein
MKPYSQDELNTIVSRLQQVEAKQNCQRCCKDQFTVLSKRTALIDHSLESDDRHCVTVVCNNCGALTTHLMDVLLPKGVWSASELP